MRIRHGRVPTIDLSYLTLAPMIGAASRRSGASGTRSLAAATDARGHRSTGRPTDGTATREGADDEEVEPTVREVLHRSREPTPTDDRSHPATRDGREGGANGRGDAQSDDDHVLAGERAADPERTPLDPGPDLERTRSDREVGDRSTAGATDDAQLAPSSRAADGATRAGRTGHRDRSAGDRAGREVDEAVGQGADAQALPEPRMRALDRSGRERSERGEDGPRRAPYREPYAHAHGPGASASGPGVPRPRMVTDAGTGPDDATMGRTSGTTMPGSGTRSPADVGSARWGRSAASADAGRAPGRQGSRLVVDRRSRGQTAEAQDRGDEDRPGNRQPGAEGSDGPADLTTDPSAALTDLLSASPDPESPVIDRLYRALQEREAIERRRGGEP